MISNAVKDENVITTLVNATATGQEVRELTEHELNTVAGGNWNVPEGVASPSCVRSITKNLEALS
jgi:bacteriocin-like protein